MKNKLTAFIGGDLCVTLLGIFGNFWDNLGHFGVKLVAAAILGAAGGVAGLVGKDYLYPLVKKLMYKLKRKKQQP